MAYSQMAAHSREVQRGSHSANSMRYPSLVRFTPGAIVPPPAAVSAQSFNAPQIAVQNGEFAMALCEVQLGNVGANMGRPSMRRPPDGYHSVSQAAGTQQHIFATFAEAQGYPSHLLFFRKAGRATY